MRSGRWWSSPGSSLIARGAGTGIWPRGRRALVIDLLRRLAFFPFMIILGVVDRRIRGIDYPLCRVYEVPVFASFLPLDFLSGRHRHPVLSVSDHRESDRYGSRTRRSRWSAGRALLSSWSRSSRCGWSGASPGCSCRLIPTRSRRGRFRELADTGRCQRRPGLGHGDLRVSLLQRLCRPRKDHLHHAASFRRPDRGKRSRPSPPTRSATW